MLHKRAKWHPINDSNVRGDINVTPLVDVCLVLLIIFMVVTPLLQKGVDVQLPETASPAKMPENEKQLNVALKLDGTVFIQEKWIPDNQLENMFADIYGRNNDREVVVKADRRLKYKDVRKLMQTINEAGFTRVGLITERKALAGA
ncbi:MAG TPA: biopolymer transporter ExbD [Thermoanaerobaculia bacterium]|jgi:biopolymer transport protein ExbD|nr:biopolymer transporter ExbD [Thermoanaerobaculia bacterium]